jgi:hypothetical protein
MPEASRSENGIGCLRQQASLLRTSKGEVPTATISQARSLYRAVTETSMRALPNKLLKLTASDRTTPSGRPW